MRTRALLAVAALIATIAAGCSEDEPAKTGGAGGSGGEGGAPIAFTIPGLSDVVEVIFDAQGVLHLSCRTDEDCAAVLGWYHAQHRFWQMDLYRRVARGRANGLISLYPESDDVWMRRFLSTRDGTPIEEAIWAILPAETKSIVEAYARGVNAWLADLRAGRNGASLTEEYRLPIVAGDPDAIPDWDPLDTVAFARLMTWQLSDSSGEEIGAGRAFSRLPPEQAVALFTLAPAMRVDTYGASGESYGGAAAAARQAAAARRLDPIRGLQKRLAEVRTLLDRAAEARAGALSFFEPLGPDAGNGSNNWVLSGSRTASGKALLANDPHLELSNPPIWYLAELDAKTRGTGTLHVAGGTFPGIPGVPIGRSEDVAWGNTTAYFDVTDVYVETLNEAGDHVLFDADGDGTPEEVAIVRKEVAFERFGGVTATVVLEWVPHHGPIVQKDVGSRRAISVRWTGHEPTDELTAFLELSRAKNLAEAREALRTFGVGAQNFLLVDREGHIGWWPHARVPRRPWASFDAANPTDPEAGSLPPWLPLPGDGSAEWQGYLSDEELPQIWNPASGFIATANQPMTRALEDGDPTNDGIPVLQTGAAPGFRMQRIVDLIEAVGNEHTPETMRAIQADTHSLPGEAIVPALLAAADAAGELDAATQRLVDALRGWEYTCPTGLKGNLPDSPADEDEVATRESIGCTAFHVALPKVYERAFGDELAAAGIDSVSHHLIRPLVLAIRGDALPFDPGLLWDDVRTEAVETRDQILLEALRIAAAEAEAHLGTDPDGWRWGRVHTLTLRSGLQDARPSLGLGPFANDGGLFTVDVGNPSPKARHRNFEHSNGASLRVVHEVDASGIRTLLQLPGGQDLHRDAEHHADLLEGWLANEPFVLPFTREEVDEAAIQRLYVGPSEE